MAFINVAEWTPENVAQWLQGLEDCILPYVHFFLNNQINGCRLLLLSSEDLTKLNVTKIGHQEIILDGVDLLKHLHYNFNSETLQSLALRLGCKSRSLYNQLKQEQEELQINLNNLNQGSQAQSSAQNAINKNGTIKESKNKSHKNSTKKQDTNLNSQSTLHKNNKVSTKTLFAVCDILNAAKTFISWIDRYPFEGQEIYIPIRKTILKLSIELASTAQRDQFVDKPNNIILTNCLTFAGLCDRIVQDLHDSLAIQPASLDVALIKKRSNEELGMHIHSSYSGIHIISGIKLSSATNNCGRIDEGDEIVQVNYRTVVGWQLRKLVDIMKEYQTELILTLKKRPKHNIASGQVNLIKPFKLPLKEYSMNQKELPIIMNGSMTLRAPKPKKPLPTELYSNLDDTLINREITYNHFDNQMLSGSLSKGKAAIRRRATISGSSSSVNQCGAVRVDDLLIKNHQNSTKLSNENKQDTTIQHVAKVQPIQQNEEISSSKQTTTTTTTIPKQLTTFSVNNSNGKSVATIKSTSNSENVGIVLPNTSRSNEQQLKLSTFQSDANLSQNDLQKSINTTAPSLPPNKPPPPKPRNSTNNSNNNSLNLSNKPPIPQTEKPAIPVRPPSLISKSANLNQQIQSIKLNRFVTLKQIEDDNAMFFKQNPTSQLCQLINNCNSSTNNNTIDKPSAECNNLLSGWLYLKREHFNTLLNAKWAAKYIQLSTNYQLYAFKNEHAIKSDLVINLAAFKVSPACECKSKDNVFKVFNKHVIFLFACETPQQMRQWVDTLRQLVSNCASTKPELMRLSTNPDIACYSETEDEEDVIDDEMMLQNFANELVETNKQQETIESKIDLIKTETIINDEKQLIKTEEDIKQIKLDEIKSTPNKIAKNEEKLDENNYENTDDDKHCRRMNRLLERRSRQRYTSTAESCRDSSPSSTSSGSSSANTSSAGQAVLSRFAAISELKERLQKQAQEKLEQRRLAIASGKKMFERSASCMDASMITNLNNKLALANQANTTNNTPIKGGNLLRNKSGSQQSLLSPMSNDVFNLSNVSSVSNNSKTEPLPSKPAYMSKQVLPPIPPRPPKPSSISITNTTNTITNSTANNANKIIDNSQMISNNLDELNKRSQPLPQPRTSKNGLPINIDEHKNSSDNHNLNKENINLNKQNESILKKTLLDQNTSSLPNHKNPEYISNMIDECFSFVDEIKTEQVISKPILQNNQVNQQSNQKSELLTTAPQSLKKLDFNQQPINEANSMLNYQPNYNNNSNTINNNQMINNQLNQMNMINNHQINQMNMINNQLSEEQLYSMLMNGKLAKEEDDLDLDDDDELEFDDEECLEDDEEFSDEEDEFDLMNNQNKNNQDYNRMFNNNQMLNNNNATFNQTGNDNLFGYNSSTNQINSMHNGIQNNNDNDFCAPGPNFLNSAPGLTLNQHQNNNNNNNNNSLLNYQSDHHLRNDLGSSSNSNNYPTSSSTNSYNISPYSSISQHNNNNNQQNDHHSPTQLETAFKEHINQLSSQFSQSCNTNSMDGQASDSGVGSYVSALAQIKTQEYTNSLVQLNIEPEIRQRMIEEFQRSFQIHFATQVKTQEYMNSLPQDLDLEIKQRMIEEFQKNCHAHFTAQLQMQQKALEILGLQQNQQQQQQQQSGGQLFNMQNPQQNNIQNQMGNGLMGDNHLQQLINQQQAFNSDMLNDLDEDLDDEDLTDSEFDYDDEETDFDDFEEAEQIEAAKSNQDQGRRKSKFKLFGTSPKLLKKLTTLKQQKEKRSRTGNNNNLTANNSQGDTIDASIKAPTTDDASSVWISMGDKILNDDNELESIKDGSNNKEENLEMETKIKNTNRDDKSSDKLLLEKDQKNKSENTSLNSSHSSFVQLKTSEPAKETSSKPTSPKLASSLASKWFGRSKTTEQTDTKTTNDCKKKVSSKNAPQITQVIYKRKPDLPKLPEKQNNSKENNDNKSKQTISVPDDSEGTDDDPIYHEINETQLVLEEMRRSLNQHKTERQIIEMILQDNKLNRSTDQLKVK